MERKYEEMESYELDFELANARFMFTELSEQSQKLRACSLYSHLSKEKRLREKGTDRRE